MSPTMWHPGEKPIAWALAEAKSLEAHAAQLEVSHGPNTKGAELCRARAAALRWLADAAKGSPLPTHATPPSGPKRPDAAAAAAMEKAA